MKKVAIFIKLSGFVVSTIGVGTLIAYGLDFNPKMPWLTAVSFFINGVAIILLTDILKKNGTY